ncbi:MAG: feruloyl-CoA synthase [Gammaproteobacteria bacterium]|nr:feruloyl-CoA synthase [Gammaproteobacteria bacterium]MBU1600652.1 feruloyl-CoA synthase [Gammaproteobacteria bacterium]MBU2435108.1 feruloyl-CoA synthase [Gammaproteobacteria bacterium]MBU2448344.1 feruloyl-CoA synthase [Gammaproteobacteria bacterium]
MLQNKLEGYRAVSIGKNSVQVDQDAQGIWRMRSAEKLGDYPCRLTDRLVEGAVKHPERTLVARRDANGQWLRISYGEMLQRARAIGQALLDRGLSAERPLLILSGNDLEHLQMALGAMYAGIPYSPLSPSYSLISGDFGKLAHIVNLTTPGMVFASQGQPFALAIAKTIPSDVEVVIAGTPIEGRAMTSLNSLLATEPTTVGEANRALTGDSIAKFLFTSGSTKLPKAVTTTHRMLCSNQQMLLQTFPCFGETPPILVDWLPWNHTFGGSHNVGIALYNGGTLYIDDGKPTTHGFAETVRNLREIAPTVFFNVPKGWELLADALEADRELAKTFFSKVNLFFFAGAGLSQAAWDKLERISLEHCGERIRVMSGLGMTETSPSSTFTTGPLNQAGYVGLPTPGCEIKLVPIDEKLEVRFRGPHVMPGYWRAPEQTAEVFDEEGYYCTGDALRFADPAHPEIGLMFDGRIAEDFKLSSGTFVSVGPLRAKLISAGAPYVMDVVLTGINRDDIGALIFPRLEHCCRLAGLAPDAAPGQILAHPAVNAFLADLLRTVNVTAGGSASRIAWAHLLIDPPSADRHEITDKGSINQRAVLQHRADLVERLYAGQGPEQVVGRR